MFALVFVVFGVALVESVSSASFKRSISEANFSDAIERFTTWADRLCDEDEFEDESVTRFEVPLLLFERLVERDGPTEEEERDIDKQITKHAPMRDTHLRVERETVSDWKAEAMRISIDYGCGRHCGVI